jgi:NAD(P)-dependent dehydrogenase (short-subunit alcohol dehydrogenase family)
MTNATLTLVEQTVLVVGASSGIGEAVAMAANEQGATVILASRSVDRLHAVQRQLPHPELSRVLPLNYLDRADVAEKLSQLDQIDHLLIPAVADENKKRGRFVELSDETMRASFDKFWGQVYVTQAAAPRMSKRGSITLFSSIAALKPPGPSAGLSLMNSVQSAVVTLGQSLSLELAPVRVNVMLPGLVMTNVWTKEENERNKQWSESTLPAQHVGTAQDIAHAALYLMTNPYVTGTMQVVDGGLVRI